ncbi:general transcription factor spTFIIE beta subunit [Westerdykella ornata]|uniref:Transcription initiation factor IIE subunit beta n=1 Tax=Westerdykella ornata TaxID=318751 RepID=A0A6A6JK09_WESOR|nr:general transcription factor spTFIIE beta subunit [Westerdykella ornata]KAF2276931.1 general transcription factor spTFIIE beta subunit [Westerdykella ornata]
MSFLKSATSMAAPSPTPSTSSNSGVKRKRPDTTPASTVYSQPGETGTGHHVNTQFLYAQQFLKSEDQKWHTLEQITKFLNIPDHHIPELLRRLRSTHVVNRIEWDPVKDLYRYKPKYNIRNSAQLKGYLQNQKSAAGLPVKDLKDGWPTAVEDINELEKKNEVLVSRHKKDAQPKTVWLNDPSLMHTMDPDFKAQWHQIALPENPDDLRKKLVTAGLKPSSAPKKIVAVGPKEKKRKAPRRGGKQTNTHMAGILKDFSHLRK